MKSLWTILIISTVLVCTAAYIYHHDSNLKNEIQIRTEKIQILSKDVKYYFRVKKQYAAIVKKGEIPSPELSEDLKMFSIIKKHHDTLITEKQLHIDQLIFMRVTP